MSVFFLYYHIRLLYSNCRDCVTQIKKKNKNLTNSNYLIKYNLTWINQNRLLFYNIYTNNNKIHFIELAKQRWFNKFEILGSIQF